MVCKTVFAMSVLLAFSLNGFGQGSDPFKSTQSSDSVADAEDLDSGASAIEIPVDYSRSATFGSPGCPVFVVGNEVFNSRTFKAIGELEEEYDAQGLRSLSLDGRWFAASSKSPNQTETTVFVWSTETGKKVMEVSAGPEEYTDVVTISRNAYLLLGGRHSNQIDVWEISTNRKLPKSLTAPDRRIEPDGKLVFTSDGSKFAAIANDKLVIISTATNKPVATMAPPGSAIAQAKKSAGTRRRETTEETPLDANNPSFVYAWTSAIQFSANGEELAAFSTHPHPRLLIWSSKGKLLVDDPVPMPYISSHKPTITWTPDGKGLLLNGFLIDRDSRAVLLSVRSPRGSYVWPHLLDQDTISGSFGELNTNLQTRSIPWPQINESLQAMENDSAALLTPNRSISLEIDAPNEEIRQIMSQILIPRLSRDGLQVQPGQSACLHLSIVERQGATLPIYESQSRFDRQGQDTGRRATEVEGAAVLEWRVAGRSEPLWRGHLIARSGRSFSEEINDTTIRNSMLDEINVQLQGMDIPYFIPSSENLPALPVVLD